MRVKAEFKVKLIGSPLRWEEIRVQTEEFASWEHAVNYAKARAYEFNAEIRLNEQGSLQGHYFRP